MPTITAWEINLLKASSCLCVYEAKGAYTEQTLWHWYGASAWSIHGIIPQGLRLKLDNGDPTRSYKCRSQFTSTARFRHCILKPMPASHDHAMNEATDTKLLFDTDLPTPVIRRRRHTGLKLNLYAVVRRCHLAKNSIQITRELAIALFSRRNQVLDRCPRATWISSE